MNLFFTETNQLLLIGDFCFKNLNINFITNLLNFIINNCKIDFIMVYDQILTIYIFFIENQFISVILLLFLCILFLFKIFNLNYFRFFIK